MLYDADRTATTPLDEGRNEKEASFASRVISRAFSLQANCSRHTLHSLNMPREIITLQVGQCGNQGIYSMAAFRGFCY